MSERARSQKKELFVCTACHQAFMYDEKEAQGKLCRNCLQTTLVPQITRTILVCPNCNRHYDSSQITNIEVPKFKRPEFQLGKLVCNRDSHALINKEMASDIKDLTKKIYGKFIQDKENELVNERAFLDKLSQVRLDEMAAHQQALAQQEAAQAAAAEVAISEENRIYLDRPTTWPLDQVFETPHADEFWRHYYIDRQIYDPANFLGDEKKVLKIKGLLDEVNLYLLNPDKIRLGLPVIDEMTVGKIFFVGDTHGSIYDTDQCIKFFVNEIEKSLKNDYKVLIIFIGDYVDRHEMDIHNLLYILSFALQFPQNVRLLRGNHEEVTINMQYGFWANINKYLPNSYLFNDFEYTFMNLPLVHLTKTAKGNIMTLHGGVPFYPQDSAEMPRIPCLIDGSVELKPSYSTVEEMDKLSQQILWGDPEEELPPNHYYLPSRRGIGYGFGREIFEKFLELNKINRVVRSHEVFLEGHKEYFENRLFSIFSSSSYGERDIEAKILEMDFDKPYDVNWKLYTILDEFED